MRRRVAALIIRLPFPRCSYDVIIVGAGGAGIAAASASVKKGLTVLLLEGRARPFGRVFTDRSWGYGVDLGASAITGLDGNVLTDIARR